MKLLRIAILLSVIPALAFGQRGGGMRGGGGARSGGGGARSSGGGARSSGGSVLRGGGGFSGGGIARGGSNFRGNVIVRGGGTRFVNNTRYLGGRFYYPSSYYYPSFYLGLGYGGYPYSYGYDPYYYEPYSYGDPYDSGYVGYAPPAPPVPPQPPAVINQNIGTPSGSFYRAADFYLIAFTDHTIRAALSYTAEGDQIRYTTREHEERTAPLSDVDLRFSEQINRDRRVEFKLP